MRLHTILIKEARLKKGLTQAEVAKVTGVLQPTISRVELGDSDDLPMRLVVAYVRAKLLNKTTVHDLIYSYDLDTAYTDVKKITCNCGHQSVYRVIDKVKCVLCGSVL